MNMNDMEIRQVVRWIVSHFPVEKIILFSRKTDVEGRLCSFKLCVIIPNGVSSSVERDIYLGCESNIAFDLLVYTASEWQALQQDPHSFAHKVNRTGSVIYG